MTKPLAETYTTLWFVVMHILGNTMLLGTLPFHGHKTFLYIKSSIHCWTGWKSVLVLIISSSLFCRWLCWFPKHSYLFAKFSKLYGIIFKVKNRLQLLTWRTTALFSTLDTGTYMYRNYQIQLVGSQVPRKDQEHEPKWSFINYCCLWMVLTWSVRSKSLGRTAFESNKILKSSFVVV